MADTILQKIADDTRKRVEQEKQQVSLKEMEKQAWEIRSREPEKQVFPFEQALSGTDIGFICECKKASPSKGLIAPDFPYLEIAKEYEAAGASCISVLTEPRWFLGENRFLKEITDTVRIPCIRKDFTVDEYMIY